VRQLRCAYLTMKNMGAYVTDADLSIGPMAARGWAVDMVAWQDTSIDWADYDAVYICTTWDYPEDVETFIDVLEKIDRSSALLVNDLSLVRWTLEKTYLRDLDGRGAAIVPSSWYERIDVETISEFFAAHGSDKVVIKPVIGANAMDTYVLKSPVTDDVVERLLQVFRGRRYFVQPFIENIHHEGEFSLFFFAGVYSHAVLKRPKAGDFRSQEEHGADIASVEPDPALIEVATQIVALVDPQPVYVRADFVRDDDDRFLLMELELIEPSLYFRADAAAADRFACAFDQHFRNSLRGRPW